MSISTEESSRSAEVIARIYSKRGKDFIATLDKVLQAVASDKIVKQMLSSQTSGQFITKRLEELFYQIITDDREIFIAKIMEKLQAYENVYREEYGEMIKVLGNRILSVSDAQNSGALSRMRHIQTLITQINELQEEVSSLRQLKAEYEATIKELKKTRRLVLFHDLIEDDSNHIYAEIDITQLGQKVGEMQRDSANAAAQIQNLKIEFHKMIAKASQSSRDTIYALKQHIENMQSQYFAENAKYESIQKKYDTYVPRLQKELQNQANENQSLAAKLAARVKEIKDLKSKNLKALSVIDQMKREHDQLNEDLQEQIQGNKDLIKNNTSLDDELNKTKKELLKSQKLSKKLQEQLNDQQHENNENKSSIAELESQLKQLTSKNKSLTKDLEHQKSQNEDLTHHLQEKTKECNETTEKLNNQTNTNRDLSTKLKNLTQVGSEQKEKINDLQSKLDKKIEENNNLSQKLNQKSQELEQTKSNGDDLKQQLEDNIKEEKQKSDKLQKNINDQENVISDQKNKIQQLSSNLENTNNQLTQLKNDSKQQISSLTDKNAKLQDEIEQLKKSLQQRGQINENLQKTLTDTQKEFNETKWRVEELEEEINEKNKKIEEAKSSMAAMLLDKEVDKNESQKLQATLAKMTQQNEDLSNELRKQKKTNDRLTEQIEQLSNQLNTMRNDATNLTQAVEDANDKLLKTNSANKQLQAQMSHLSNAAADLSSILSALTAGNIKDALNEVNDMKKASSLLRSICSLINIDPRDDDALNRATEIAHKLSSFAQIEKMLNSDDALRAVKILWQEADQIAKMTGALAGQSIVQSVQKLLDDYESAKEFIKDVIISLSSSITPSKIEVPLSDAKANAVLQSIKSLVNQSEEDRHNIETLLNKARSVGYDGTDCLEAAIFIAKLKGEQEKQSLLELMKQQIDDLKEHLRMEEDVHKSDVDKKNKAINELKKTVIQLTEKNVKERDESQKQIQDLESEISNLKEQIKIEKDLRREIGRIGQGITADKAILKSKLSAQEFRFIEFIEGVMKKEKESREIAEKMKKARQENLQV